MSVEEGSCIRSSIRRIVVEAVVAAVFDTAIQKDIVVVAAFAGTVTVVDCSLEVSHTMSCYTADRCRQKCLGNATEPPLD